MRRLHTRPWDGACRLSVAETHRPQLLINMSWKRTVFDCHLSKSLFTLLPTSSSLSFSHFVSFSTKSEHPPLYENSFFVSFIFFSCLQQERWAACIRMSRTTGSQCVSSTSFLFSTSCSGWVWDPRCYLNLQNVLCLTWNICMKSKCTFSIHISGLIMNNSLMPVVQRGKKKVALNGFEWRFVLISSCSYGISDPTRAELQVDWSVYVNEKVQWHGRIS